VTSFVCEVMVEEENQVEVGWDVQSSRFQKDLRIEEVSLELADKALKSLGGRPLPSGDYAVVISPRVATQMLSLVGNALSAEAVQQGRSFFKGLKGMRVGSDLINITDDPLRLDGLNSAALDDEGVPHKKMDVIDGGILRDFFYDLRSSSKEGRESNGHGLKQTLGSGPRPQPTNLFFEQGTSKKDELLASDRRVFEIEDVMGFHMANPVTGEFSLGASGFFYERGQFVHAVRGVTIAGRVGEVIKNTIGVGSNLKWYGNFGSPSLLVSSLTVAGT
jgi:PmbA protein